MIMFSILSWNIQQGGGSRIFPISRAIIDLGPSVIALSEYRNGSTGNQLRTSLLKAGYRYQGVTGASSQENSVLIASKLPGNILLHPNADPDYGNNLIELQLSLFSVVSVYFPHKKKHRLFKYCQEHLLTQEKPFVITGDYNSGINYLDQKGHSFWYEDELKAWKKDNYIDAFRHFYPDKKEYSWFSHQKNGYRYDHTYVHHDLLTILHKCAYLHSWREKGLSDHSPMLTVFSG